MASEWGNREYAMWRLDTPNFLSYEDSEDRPGLLGVEWCDRCDNRWADRIVLGPHIHTIDCGAAGGTAANTNGFALSHGMNATKFIYAIRGTKWAKIKASDMSLVSDGSETELAEAATCILYTKNGAATGEISVGMANTAYRVITAVGNTTTDTHSANNESKKMRILALGTPAGVVVGLRGDAQTVEQNDISDTATMDASAWEDRLTISGETFDFSGFAVLNGVWLIGTTNGPYYFDNELADARPLIEEIANTFEGPSGAFQNCDQMGNWSFAGVLIPLEGRLRLMFSSSEGESVGPEAFDRYNRSPVSGQVTAIWGSREWLYIMVRNAVDDKTYLVAGHPREQDRPGTTWHRNFISWYVIGRLADGIESHAGKDIGYYGARTNPTQVMGYDDDVAYFLEGRVPFFPEDSNYHYETAGTAYFTELRRFPLSTKRIDALTVETSNCNASRTVTFSASVDGGTTWVQIGAPIVSNGVHRLFPNEEDVFEGRRIKLKAVFAGEHTSSPALIDRVVMHYRRKALRIDDQVLEAEA